MSLFGWGARKDKPAGAPTTQQIATAIVAPENFSAQAGKNLNVLRDAIQAASGLISTEVYSLARTIDDILRPLITYIDTHPVRVDDEVLINSILTDYVPNPLRTFLTLEKGEQVAGGQADLILQRQYATIRDNAFDLSQQVRRSGLEALQVQDAFIQSKFEQGV